MIVQTNYPSGKFEVVFRINKTTHKFDVGKKKMRPRVVTTCQIYHLTAKGKEEIGIGVTLQGRKDDHCEVECRKHSMKRALKASLLGKSTRMAFWKEFHLRFKRAEVCPHKVVAKGHGHDWCVKHKQRCYALICKKLAIGGQVVTLPVYDLDNMPKTIWPRSKAVKEEQYRRMYNYGAEARRHRVREPITIINTTSAAKIHEAMKDRIKKILDQHRRMWAWENGRWLHQKMQETAADKRRRSDLKKCILARTGIVTGVHQELLVTDKFVSDFKIDEVVTYRDEPVKIKKIHGPLVTVERSAEPCLRELQLPGKDILVWDWELEKRDGLLRRVWNRVISTNDSRTPPDEIAGKEAEPSLYDIITRDNYCTGCGGITTWIHEGSGKDVKCKYCGSKFWVDPASKTAHMVKL